MAEDVEERVLTSIIGLVRDSGFSNLTVRNIAERASVNIAYVNYHFGSKEEAINRAIDRIIRDFADDLARTGDGEPSLREFVRRYQAFVTENRFFVQEIFSRALSGKGFPKNLENVLKNKVIQNAATLFARQAGRTVAEAQDFRRSQQLAGAVLFPVLIEGLWSGFDDLPPDPESYVDELLALFYPATRPD